MGTGEKLKVAAECYQKGCTCAQAVLCAYADELGLDRESACRITEGFGGGCGGLQEICGALTAASAIISWHTSDGRPEDGRTREKTYGKVRQAAEIFRREYGGVTCREVLHGDAPKPFQCGMKVKDAVLIIEQVLREERMKGEAV